MTPEQFVDELRQALPGGLRSVVLYGSAAAGDFVDGASHYDVLVVVRQLGVAELDALSQPAVLWERSGNRAPQVFTPQELEASADAFPVELLDMQQSHKVLWGDDPLAAIAVSKAHLRLQLERELKGKLLLLRERYLVAAGKPKRVAGLLEGSVSTFLVLFRAALRLYQDAVPMPKVEALQALGGHIPFDPQPFLTVLKLKEGKLRTRDVDVAALFQSYLTAIGQIVNTVDRHIHGQSSQENAT